MENKAQLNIGDSVYVSGLVKPLKVISVRSEYTATLQGQRKTYLAVKSLHDKFWRISLTTFGPSKILQRENGSLV